jgi:hypothetical protein
VRRNPGRKFLRRSPPLHHGRPRLRRARLTHALCTPEPQPSVGTDHKLARRRHRQQHARSAEADRPAPRISSSKHAARTTLQDSCSADLAICRSARVTSGRRSGKVCAEWPPLGAIAICR